MPKPGLPNFRFHDPFWMSELDFRAHGQNLLWRLVTENTEIKWLQKNPLFPMDPETNPVLCSLPKASADPRLILPTSVEVTLSLIRIHRTTIIVTSLALIGAVLVYKYFQQEKPRLLRIARWLVCYRMSASRKILRPCCRAVSGALLERVCKYSGCI